ncbi:hypothetical protein DL240_11845 [Lujinxingia litoralis]|uniref:MalT-like TPR region domain-containing protein n=1 Tax=Lujinxingia litoralis TaxID=2211119 RepID=A0A328C5Z4_9DELT|nr:DUF6483 family protein [Lujinxingia litoralis]RAL21543.1 hypothetical protein DL240_11845 [Lujinxingia litoralis]
MEDTRWLDAQLKAVQDLVNVGSQALRQNQNAAGAQALREANVILDMAEDESDEVLKLRARVSNELGVAHQRLNMLEESLGYHGKAAEICTALIERGEHFEANSAATHLNLSSIFIAMGRAAEALEAGQKAIELIGVLREREEAGVDALELGANQNMAVIYAREERFDEADAAMERAYELSQTLAEAGQANFQAQLAQGCQQLSVILFDMERYEHALRWGRSAEELSEKAFEALGQPVLPVYIISQINLISYYERLGRFADAEDCLWKALDVAGNDAQILKRGVVFYETCRKQADARLEEGNLPRDEVEESFEELSARIEKLGGMEAVDRALQQAQQRGRR